MNSIFSPEMLKSSIAVFLEKQGFSLMEFEEALKNQPVTESAAEEPQQKQAVVGDAIKAVYHGMTGLGGMAALLGIGAGGMGYLTYDKIRNTNKKLEEERERIRLIQEANSRLQQELARRKQIGFVQ